jgi:serine/threonine protein kinase
MISPSLAAKALDAASLAEELARYRVIPPDQLADLLDDFPGQDAMALVEFLVARKALTQFQADRARGGQTGSLTLGPYRLLGPHRGSSLGPVFRAEKPGRSREGPFAIRVTPLRSLWQARQAKQMARAISALPQHPAVVRLLDVDSANGYHYLVWPLTSGDLLADRIRATGPLPPLEVARLLAQLASGLVACHDRDVAHGLLTPMSVALPVGPNDTAALLDLGVGALLTQDLAANESLLDTFSTANAFAGAIGYLAPEWIADPTHLTPAADQYSLGAVGYFALTGQAPPFGQVKPVADNYPEVPPELAAPIDLLCPPSEAINTSRRPTTASSHSGSVTWPSEPGFSRPPERDDSDASIRFDLPDNAAQAPTGEPGGEIPAAGDLQKEAGLVDSMGWEDVAPANHDDPGMDHGLTDTPRGATNETNLHGGDQRKSAPDTERERSSGASRPEQHRTTPRLLDLPVTSKAITAPPLLPAGPLPQAHRDMTPLAAARVLGSRVAPPRAEPAPYSAQANRNRREQEPVLPLWKSIRRKVLFWQVPTDTIQVSVFGPSRTARSEAPRVTVYLHPPSATESVTTLARAFQHEAVLLGIGSINHPIQRGAYLAIHLAITHTAVTTPLGSCIWQGQPHRQTFDLVVPWEAPLGLATGVVSVGQENVRIGKIVFHLPIDGEAI